LPFVWVLERARFPIKGDVYHADADTLAFMVEGSVAVALFAQTLDARRHLADVLHLACRYDVETPVFVVPWLDS
jgi:hypothetical protein